MTKKLTRLTLAHWQIQFSTHVFIVSPCRQFFSAAFNLFTPIKVDSKTTVTDKLEIARLAIQIAKEGGFEKVTWDGAEDGKVPSDPITDTLGM